MRRLRRDDSGAVAVLVAVVVTAVLVPLAGWALTSYARGGADSEFKAAGDAGALAGAARIPLADLTFIENYLAATAPAGTTLPAGFPTPSAAQTTLDTLLPPGSSTDPLTIAKNACTAAWQALDRYNSAYAQPYQAPNCYPAYADDGTFLSTFGQCVANLLGPTGTTIPEYQTLEAILPALFRPGVKVLVTWAAQGPLDKAVDSNASPIAQSSFSQARRVIKSAIALTSLSSPLPALTGPTISLDPTSAASRTALLNALAELETATAPLLQPYGCNGAFAALAGDFADASDPASTSLTPSGDTTQTLQDAVDTGATVVDLTFSASLTGVSAAGTLSLTDLLQPQSPFFDFVPVCVEQSGTTFAGVQVNESLPFASPDPAITTNTSGVSCYASAPGAFRAVVVR